eukprot:879712-Rhodomonas_salina.2
MEATGETPFACLAWVLNRPMCCTRFGEELYMASPFSLAAFGSSWSTALSIELSLPSWERHVADQSHESGPELAAQTVETRRRTKCKDGYPVREEIVREDADRTAWKYSALRAWQRHNLRHSQTSHCDNVGPNPYVSSGHREGHRTYLRHSRPTSQPRADLCS